MRFVADCMLGKLAKWLRMLGYDTVYIAGADDDELVRIAVREDRVLLTRDLMLRERRMVRRRSVFVDWGTTSEQVRQVFRELGLSLESAALFTRCTICNSEIRPMEKRDVEGRVPPYVFETQAQYGYCSACDKIYWRGTHWQAMCRRLQTLKELS